MNGVSVNKIVYLDELVDKVRSLKKSGKVVVQSHGIFDIIHPGIIQHIKSAREAGDVLVVTVIKDKDVRRGPGRPIFGENYRLENVASLQQVDYVCLVDDEVPFECVRRIQPDVFAKGTKYRDRDRIIHGKIFEEEKSLHFGKTTIHETEGFSFSSSTIINNFLDMYPEETKKFLKNFSAKFGFKDVAERLNALKDLKVLLIGDGIIDEYHYCTPMGKSAKAHLVVNKFLNHEVFAGGAFAIANHVASVCKRVHLVTLLGKDDSRERFVLESLKPNVDARFFYRDDGPTIVKKRYINQYINQKLFEINYINDEFISGPLEAEVVEYLNAVVKDYDVVLVSDFGHGFLTGAVIRAIEGLSRKVAVNTQTNGANVGYNLIIKYRNPSFICLDEAEARLATQEKFAEIEDVAAKLRQGVNTEYLMITLGKKGSIGFNHRSEEVNRTPIFSSKVVDTVGAGDAFFAYTAPCILAGMPLDLVSFIGNAVGALAVQIVGNKKAVDKHELLEFVSNLLR